MKNRIQQKASVLPEEALNDEALEDVSGGVVFYSLLDDDENDQGSTGEQPSGNRK